MRTSMLKAKSQEEIDAICDKFWGKIGRNPIKWSNKL